MNTQIGGSQSTKRITIDFRTKLLVKQPPLCSPKRDLSNVDLDLPTAVLKPVDGVVPAGGPEGEVPPAANGFIHALGLVLEHLCRNTPAGHRATSFDGVRVPPIGLEQYAERMRVYIPCGTESYVFAIIYIDRILKRHPDFVVSELNVHRLFMASIVIACKFHEDFYFSNTFYAMVGGVSTKELNLLEARMLKLLGWSVNVSPTEYQHYHDSVMHAASSQERGKPLSVLISGYSLKDSEPLRVLAAVCA